MTARIFKDKNTESLIIFGPSPKFPGLHAVTIFTYEDDEYLPSYDYTLEFGASENSEKRVSYFETLGTYIKTESETFDDWYSTGGRSTIERAITTCGVYTYDIVEMTDFDINTPVPVGDEDFLYDSPTHINRDRFYQTAA